MVKCKQLQKGNETEKLVCEMFKKYGYWSHILQKGKDGGQPCDVVAMKENINWQIDAKHVEDEISFPFSRIESNQITSMDYAMNFSKIKNLGFAIYFERFNKLYFMHFLKYLELKNQKRKSVRYDELVEMEEVLNDRS